jgi:hypothetical protein
MRDVLVKSALSVVAVLSGALATDADALELTLQAGYGAEYTNNTALTPNNENSEWIQTPQATLNLTHEGPSISALVDYNITQQIYQDDTYGNQTNTVGNANLTWRAIPDRWLFELQNASTLTTINAQNQNVPTNQQVINTSTAGTTLMLDGPSNHNIDLHYDYAVTTAQDTNTDSKRQTGTIAYVIPLSPQRRIQLNGSLGHVDYESSLYTDYDSKSGDLQFVNQGETIELDTSIGYTVFDRDVENDVSGVTGDIHLIWNASESTHFNASYARTIQDQSENLVAGIPHYGQNFVDNTNLTTPYTQDAYSVGVATELGHNLITLAGNINYQNYDGTQVGQTVQDQDTKGVTLGITRALRQTLRAQMFANYTDTDFHDGDRQKNFSTGIRFDWTRWRNLTISAGTEYAKQTSDVPASEYNVWTGTLTLMYTILGNARR